MTLGCNGGATSATPEGSGGATTTGAPASGGSAGLGGSATSSDPTSGSTTKTTSATATGVGGTTDPPSTVGIGGSAGADPVGAGGAAGAAGAGPGPGTHLTCASFPDDDPSDRCEPKLRALLSSFDGHPLTTFAYDAGRITAVREQADEELPIEHRYTYDDHGRLSRFEFSCVTVCEADYEFSYAAGGWLETMTVDGEYRTTYGEDGRTLEERDESSGTRYLYRSDGQIEAEVRFSIEGGVEVEEDPIVYEYGDDDLVDRIVFYEDFPDGTTTYTYVLEGDRVRVERRYDWITTDARIFDDFGNLAFRWHDADGESQSMYAYVDSARLEFSSRWTDYFTRHRLTVPQGLFPYRPFEASPDDIDDLSYEYEGSVLTRRPAFSDTGQLEHLTLTSEGEISGKFEIELQRCGGVVLESIDFTGFAEENAVFVYYYGCDDFELPPLPALE